MGEVPVLTISAQVFQIDQETKSKWVPLTQHPVAVSLYHDNSMNTYRIICVEEDKVIINCFVKPKMKFVKTSQKFGQWVDSQAATVYGIGCKSEVELMKFADKFDEVKQILPSDSPKLEKTTSSTMSLDQLVKDTNVKPANGLASKPYNKKTPPPSDNHIGSDLKCTSSKCTGVIALLRAENDRLKLELAHSSSKTKEWEFEVQSLKKNSAMLTTALEESRRNAEEWQKQLRIYDDKMTEANNKLNETRDQLKEAEQQASMKEEDLMKLRQQYNEQKRMDAQNQKAIAKLQEAESENARLIAQVGNLTSQLGQANISRKPNHQGLKKLQEEISSKINELYAMNDMLAEELQSYIDS